MDEPKDDSKRKSFSARLLCLGKDGTFLRSIGGILCIYYGICFAIIGVCLTSLFPQRSKKLLKVIDPMVSEWWYSIGFCGEMITLIWGIITTIIVYTHPNTIFSILSSKLIYGLGNLCAAKLGSEIAILNMSRCVNNDNCSHCDNDTINEEEIVTDSEGITSVTLLGATK